MIRMIIAEDEYFARKALVKMLHELDEEIEICGEAETGLEVLDMMQETQVDIVLTDIRMPDMDGLDLAKEISEKYQDVSVIIETGFAEFDYAARAIKYGVKEYLTKPIRKEELEETIHKIKADQMRFKRQLEKKLEVKNAQHMDFTYILQREELSERLLGGLLEEMRSDCWYMGVAQSRERGITQQQIEQVLEILEKPENDCSIHASFFRPKEEFILALGGCTMEPDLPANVLHKKIVACQALTGVELEAGISLVQKKSQAPIKEAAAIYREAVYAINQRLLNPGKQIYFYDPDVSVKSFFSQAEERNLEHFLTEGKVKDAEQLLEHFFVKCDSHEKISSYSLFFSLVQIMNVMNRVYNQKQDKITQGQEASMLFSFKTDLYVYRTLDEIKEYVLQILHDVCGVEEQKSSIVADLLKYLEWNYQYDITVNDLAMHKYFVNPSYLSRLFKAETGQPFSRYLIELRMKNAAQMLKNSNLKVSDVAICVGYNDVSYFIQTFKKHYGITPEQYKKNMS